MGACGHNQHTSHGTNTMEEAQLIAIYDRDGYDEVYIVTPGGEEVAHYFLVASGDSLDFELPEGAVEITVPLKKAVIDSEVYASAFEELGVADAIGGLFDAAYVTSPALRREIDSGRIRDVGQTVSPNAEGLLSLQPDAILVSYFEGMQTQGIDKLGVPVVKMYDLQESSPLGRAEWLRFIARLVGKDETGDSIFSEVKSRYETIKGWRNDDKDKPKVITDLVYQGTWSVPGGASYQAKLLDDAGASYFKKADHSPVTLNLSPEQVVAEGTDADVWIIRYYGDGSQLKAILGSDPIYKGIKAYTDGNVYYSDTSKSGLFREFPFHPDRLLEDYQIIFTGDSVSSLRYFEKLER